MLIVTVEKFCEFPQQNNFRKTRPTNAKITEPTHFQIFFMAAIFPTWTKYSGYFSENYSIGQFFQQAQTITFFHYSITIPSAQLSLIALITVKIHS